MPLVPNVEKPLEVIALSTHRALGEVSIKLGLADGRFIGVVWSGADGRPQVKQFVKDLQDAIRIAWPHLGPPELAQE